MGKAVVDRIEGRLAVLLLQEGDKRLDVPVEKLPKRVKEGDWLKVELANGQVVKAEIDAEETARRRARIADLMDKLRQGQK